MKPLRLNKEQFLEVLARTPLVYLDLVIKDPKGRILLGRRVNEPALGKWFVPEGRILKNLVIGAGTMNTSLIFEKNL